MAIEENAKCDRRVLSPLHIYALDRQSDIPI